MMNVLISNLVLHTILVYRQMVKRNGGKACKTLLIPVSIAGDLL